MKIYVGNLSFNTTQDGLQGLHVTRKVFVPRDGYFVRHLERLENRGTEPVIVDVRLEEVKIGMPVKLEFRRSHMEGHKGVINYGHKAVPLRK